MYEESQGLYEASIRQHGDTGSVARNGQDWGEEQCDHDVEYR